MSWVAGVVQAVVSDVFGGVGVIQGRKAQREARELAEISRQDARQTDVMKQDLKIENQRTVSRGLGMKRSQNAFAQSIRDFQMDEAEGDYNRSILNTQRDSVTKGLAGSLASSKQTIERLRQ